MKNTNYNSDTLLSYWFFFTYRSSYFAVSLQTLIPNLYTFLSLSYSFLLVAGWCCPIPTLFPTMMWKSKRSYALTEISYFYGLEKPR
jgi:hypothetical protein